MAKKSSIARESELTTILGPGTALTGKLSFESNLMIRGSFEGDIDAKGALYIDQGATIKANKIKAMSIFVAGSVIGDLEALDKVELKPSAQVRGNVRTSKLRIADGVIFEGRCEMIGNREGFDPFGHRPKEER